MTRFPLTPVEVDTVCILFGNCFKYLYTCVNKKFKYVFNIVKNTKISLYTMLIVT